MKCIDTFNDLSEITGNYLALETAFSLRTNSPGTQETTKQDSKAEMRLS
jgi:hypothetical protein